MFSGSKDKKFALFGTAVASLFAAIAFWVFIDAVATSPRDPVKAYTYVCILVTVGFEVLLNLLNWETVSGRDEDAKMWQVRIGRLLFFICVVMMVGGNLGAFFIMYFGYIQTNSVEFHAGVEIFVSSLLFLFGFVILRFCRQRYRYD
ncbi:putative Uncharacterized protein family (UPF0220) [Monocercomonoides exilis]|uniref:putative Uncharacterized protein family (UPF0220) n=1 Tax=Monocercomonoides exilis TaxID=2049356 RepID=UPI003559DE91|nr:putative Uncharacterized protein family (UPF0220) [Monocercomonoides exilis]|eukprot:MONOS_5424.1-p1 / transcript=MONOS_5424.1 / gene=MONOS_5424 / organism=Monocercomonoides_exilis_PA203 / gene_product=unspecified product / transcript_product=unspecified product / location=Mono_scaffold00157:84344-85075(+) / protein_length=146 / sequence_SO=supercontig / SO=protein_coding / is_pseudo=false